ncbi:MAG: HD domain-containing protein [Dehalococcoidales bacterium]|nr:HD domain-containing protein [Dehalococcoidales bacterium]
MRRISVEYAQLGMILGRAVYDGAGRLVLDAGTVLDAIHVPVLSRLEVREIIIQDKRVDDVIIIPLLSEEIEANAIRLLHRLIDSNRGKIVSQIRLDMDEVDRVIKSMVQGFISSFMGEINAEGCLSIGNFDYVHPVKVTGLALVMGQKLGLNKTDLVKLGTASLLQNIGYIQIPQQILLTLDPATEEKSTDFRTHPEIGIQLLGRQFDLDKKIMEAVAQHHEKWNGGGFPAGLKKERISLYARIIAIAGAYHALVSHRRNQPPLSPPEAAEFISAYSGEYFDPELAELFVRSIPFYAKGAMVMLSSGESGVVTNSNIGFIGRPNVRIFYDRMGNELDPLIDIDLKDTLYQNRLVKEILET